MIGWGAGNVCCRHGGEWYGMGVDGRGNT